MSLEQAGYTIGSSGPITEVDGLVKIDHVFRRVGDFGVAGLVHELGVGLVVLGQTVNLGGG